MSIFQEQNGSFQIPYSKGILVKVLWPKYIPRHWKTFIHAANIPTFEDIEKNTGDSSDHLIY
jgi:hypothetical protein